jgi:hypothetical protein
MFRLIAVAGRVTTLGLVLVLAGSVAPVGAGAAAPTTLSGLVGGGYLVVDEAHQHVFVTGAPPQHPWDGTGANSTIVVMNFDGSVAKTITGESGAAGMTISGGTLYVARCGATTIDTFSTATLVKTGTLTVGRVMLYPCDLAIQGGRLWYDVESSIQQIGAMASLTLASPHVETLSDLGDAPVYAEDPADPGQLLVADTYGEPADFHLWDISASPWTVTTYNSALSGIVRLGTGMAVTADGQHVWLIDESGSPSRYPLPSLAAPDKVLTEDLNGANALALSPDGGYIATAVQNISDTGIDVTPTNQTSPTRFADLGLIGNVTALGFAADDSRLFVLATHPGYYGDTAEFVVLDAPTMVDSLLTASPAPANRVPGQTSTISGTLSFKDSADASGKALSITMTRPDASKVTLPAVATGSGGSFSMTTEPLSEEGDYVFAASYAGDSSHLPSSVATATVHVAKIGASLQMQATPASMYPGGTAALSGSLTYADASSTAGQEVALHEQRPDKTTLDLGTVTVAADGTFAYPETESLGQDGTYTFTAAYAGDATHAAATVTAYESVHRDATHTTLAASRQEVIYGQSLWLTAQLTSAPVDAQIAITRTSQGVTTIVTEAAVDASGTLQLDITPRRNATYSAVYAGDGTHAPSHASVSIKVQPIATGRFTNSYRARNGYRLFHYHSSCASSGAKCPLFATKVTPNKRGKFAYIVIQQHTRRGWQSVAALRKRLSRRSQATFKIRYLKAAVIGKAYRVAIVVKSDSATAGVAWGYWYFRITR